MSDRITRYTSDDFDGKPRRMDEPPEDTIPHSILRVKAHSSEQFLLLADRHEAYAQHWVLHPRAHSAKCIDPQSQCQHCQLGREARWRGYHWAMVLPRNVEFGFVEFTKEVYLQCKRLLGPGSWMGARIEIRRGGKTATPTVMLHEILPAQRIGKLPINNSVLPILEELWRRGARQAG